MILPEVAHTSGVSSPTHPTHVAESTFGSVVSELPIDTYHASASRASNATQRGDGAADWLLLQHCGGSNRSGSSTAHESGDSDAH